ncbi:MAG TPA: TlpA disulfide reductase family protein [Syntrophorhabdaceae bacterium]|nr:TlpA disulfide reductase family protein [Syntrophorhabdaceae bacterium]
MSIKKLIVLVCAAAALYACFQLFPGGTAALAQTTQLDYSDRRMPLPAFELPIPQDRAEREYLGLSDKGTFKVGDIKSQIVIIEIFSFYCPICQVHAPLVHEVYEKIKARADLKEKIRMIGIAATNTAFEARSFKETYNIPFPVFSDEEGEIALLLGVKYTPTFIGVKVDGKGGQEQFYFLPKVFTNPTRFIEDIMKTSGLE